MDTAPPVSKSIEEANQQILGKLPKIQTGLEASFLQQMHEIGKDEVATVKEYRDKKLNIGGKSEPGATHHDLIITDNMHIQQPRQNILLPFMLGLMGGGIPALVLLGMSLLQKPAVETNPQPSPPVVKPPDVSVDDLKLRVKWRIDENGKIQTEVVEEK